MFTLIFFLLSTLILTMVTAAPNNAAAVLPSSVIGKTQVVEFPHLRSVELPAHVEVHEPTIAKLGEVVESIPTAVSHQSSTVVHSRAQRVTPVVAPAVRTYTAPLLHSIGLAGGVIAPAATAALSLEAQSPMQLLWRTYPYATYAASYPHGYGGPFAL